MYCVNSHYNNHIRSARYCPFCYDRFEGLALAETPDLFQEEVNEDAAAVQLDALLHLTKNVKPHGQDKRIARWRHPSPAMVMLVPVALLVDGLPFKRYYLTGDDLARHAEEARRLMCVEVSDAS